MNSSDISSNDSNISLNGSDSSSKNSHLSLENIKSLCRLCSQQSLIVNMFGKREHSSAAAGKASTRR